MENGRTATTLHCKDCVAGWLDSSVRDFLEAFPQNSRNVAFALITCLDSDSDPRALFKRNKKLRASLNGAIPVGKGLLFPSQLLRNADICDQLFVGFDEIWFLRSDKIEPKPDAWIVGPSRIDEGKLDQLGRWMSGYDCSLGLGDGDGLNIIVRARGLVRDLIAHSMSQPEPNSRMNELWVENEEKKSPRAMTKRVPRPI